MIIQPTPAAPRPTGEPPARIDAAAGGRFLQAFLADAGADRAVSPPEAEGAVDARLPDTADPDACPPIGVDVPGLIPPPPSPEPARTPVDLVSDCHADRPGLPHPDGDAPAALAVAKPETEPEAGPTGPQVAAATGPATAGPGTEPADQSASVTVQQAEGAGEVPGRGLLTEPVARPKTRPLAERLWSMQGLLADPTAGETQRPSPGSEAATSDPGRSAAGRHTVPDHPVTSQAVPTPPPTVDEAPAGTGPVDAAAAILPGGPQPSPAGPATGPVDASPRASSPAPAAPPTPAAVAASPVQGTVTLALAPEELGSLHLRMTEQDGGLHVTLSAERPETLVLLRRHAGELAQDLRQAGFASPTFSFADGGDAGRGDPRNRPAPPASLPAVPSLAASGQAASDAPRPSTIPGATGTGLDLRL